MALEFNSEEGNVPAPELREAPLVARSPLDPLSEFLHAVRLTGARFTDQQLVAPWSWAVPKAEPAVSRRADAERQYVFHWVTQGECVLEMDEPGGEPPLRLASGEVALVLRGDAHRLTSVPARANVPGEGGCPGAGTTTRVVCGYLTCEAHIVRILFAGLAPVMRINMRNSSAGFWLEASLRYALTEAGSPSPGGSGMLAKLAEVLVVEMLRLCLHEQRSNDSPDPAERPAGMTDRIVGATLDAMHLHPAHPWTLGKLARTAVTSRTVLAKRFHELMGISPMQYLMQWRMLIAADLLCASDIRLVRVAETVGYQTDTAFNRAFRREFGMPPSRWRKTRAPRKG